MRFVLQLRNYKFLEPTLCFVRTYVWKNLNQVLAITAFIIKTTPMKKIVLFSSLAVFGLAVQAQISIVDTDVAVAGTQFTEATDDNPASSITGGPGGANQTWNFSALNQDDTDTTFFVNADWKEKHEEFPTATIAIYQSSDDSSWQFLSKTPTEINVVGGVEIDPLGDTLTFGANLQFLTFPSTLGTSFTSGPFELFSQADSFGIDPDGPGPHALVDSLRVTVSQSIESEMDASGTLTTPFGTFDVLRQNSMEITSGEAEMYADGMWQPLSALLIALIGDQESDTTANYRWWTNDANVGFPLVEYEYDLATGDPVDGASWLLSQPTVVGIADEAKAIQAKLYPNPATEQLTVEGANLAGATFKMMDLTGKTMVTKTLQSDRNVVSLNNRAQGLYIYSIISPAGETLKQGKVTVLK